MKNKAIHAMIIGACILANSMAGVYADTTAPDAAVSIQIEQVKYSDDLLQKHSEIFETNEKNFADKGIKITNTGVVGDYVEVGITPFNQENADYIYKIFGKEAVKVVDGMEATTFNYDSKIAESNIQLEADTEENDVRVQLTAAPKAQKASPVAAFFQNVVEWFKNIF